MHEEVTATATGAQGAGSVGAVSGALPRSLPSDSHRMLNTRGSVTKNICYLESTREPDP